MDKKPEKSTKIQHLITLCDKLPDLEQKYIMNHLDKSIATKTIYAYELLRFHEYLGQGNDTYEAISYSDITGYLRSCIEKGNGWNTVQRTRTALNGLFYFLNEIEAVSGNPVCTGKALEKLFWEMKGTDPKSAQKEEAPPAVAEFLDTVENGTGLSDSQKKYHEKYRLRDTAIVTLILDTGIKISALNQLNIEDFDREYSLVYSQKRALKLKTETTEKLEQYLDQDRVNLSKTDSPSPLFATADGRRLAVRSIQRILKKYSAAGNIPQAISAEKLREISAANFYRETKDMQELKERLGIKSIIAVEKYVK